MDEIENFYETRKDGQIIPEGKTLEQIQSLGEISKVVEVSWISSTTQQRAHLKSPFGVFSRIVQGRKWIAALIYKNNSDCKLIVVNPDGNIHLTVPSIQKINNEYKKGSFGWFEAAHHPANGVFGVVFQVAHPTTAQYWLDIDALTGKVLMSTWTR
jgi:hypothetical protein